MRSLARFGSVALFLASALTGVTFAGIAANEEAYTSWTTPASTSWLIFGGAALAASALAFTRRGSVLTHGAAALLLVPAFVLQSEASPDLGSPDSFGEWLATAGAAALILLGGLLTRVLRTDAPQTHG